MAVFKSILDIFICFFSIFGVYFVVMSIFDRIAFYKAPSKTVLYIKEYRTEDLEYLVRFYESRIINGDFEDMISGIVIKRENGTCENTVEKLAKEFGNIYFE